MNTIALARQIRLDALKMTNLGGTSHIGSVFSIADILAVLYGGVLRINTADPQCPGRDRFILSKGHAGAGVYAALAERGFFPRERLWQHCQDGSGMSGHVSHAVPGAELSTGSLGMGLSVGAGMAYAAAADGRDSRVFVLVGDGECDEGAVWEAAMFASHHGLDNLVAIVDYNGIQSLASVAETLALEPFAGKWRAFGWEVAEVNGHNHDELREAFHAIPIVSGRPSCVLAHTVKGKGVSFMENSVLWHYRTARGEEYAAALAELEAG